MYLMQHITLDKNMKQILLIQTQNHLRYEWFIMYNSVSDEAKESSDLFATLHKILIMNPESVKKSKMKFLKTLLMLIWDTLISINK